MSFMKIVDVPSHDDATDELIRMMAEKAQVVFALCDLENKGFITKRDMQRLQLELPLSPQQLEDVFDSLDVDADGYLTLQEFTEGFGSFLGLSGSSSSIGLFETYESDLNDSENSPSEKFEDLMQNFGACGLLEDTNVIKSLWNRLQQNQPEVLSNFEDFLQRITSMLRRTHMDYRALQISMENKKLAHDEEIQSLYSEMEAQIAAEKERIQAEEKLRERKLRERMERELYEKDKRLSELIAQQKEMERKLFEYNNHKVQTVQENERLLKEKEEMEKQLDTSNHDLEEIKTRITELQKQQRNERLDRTVAASQISEWIALERESLLKQLNGFKEMNRKLMDSHDEVRSTESTPSNFKRLTTNRASVRSSRGKSKIKPDEVDSKLTETRPDVNENVNLTESFNANFESDTDSEHSNVSVSSRDQQDESEYDDTSDDVSSVETTPSRMFKIVLVGDSDVGKTTFIHRVCNKMFISSFSATIGVDFQIHNVKVDRQMIALQLWDTAGQERFRSITKQYFRKADGVLVMYDVTSDISFRNIREWMESIQLSVEEGTVVVLIGNKRDLVDEEEEGDDSSSRNVPSKHGQKVADEYGAAFFETSSKSGLNVDETIKHMARLLRDREDQQLEKVLHIGESQLNLRPTRSCCDF